MSTTLLIIDMQLGNFQGSHPVHEGDRLLERVRRLIDKARSARARARGRQSTDSLFNDLLERFEAKGLFVHNDMDINFDKMSLWISFEALTGCDLYVHSFDISLMGLVRLEATYHVEIEKVDDLAIRRMRNIVDNVRESIDLPDSFQDLMEFVVDIDEYEESIILGVDITEESLDYLPLVPDISILFKQILDKSGLKYF